MMLLVEFGYWNSLLDVAISLILLQIISAHFFYFVCLEELNKTFSIASYALLGNMDLSDDIGPHQQYVNTSGSTFRKKEAFVSVIRNFQFQEIIVQML